MINKLKSVLLRCASDSAAERDLMGFMPQLCSLSTEQKSDLLRLLLEFVQENSGLERMRPVSILLSCASEQQGWLDEENLSQADELYAACPADQVVRNQLLYLLADSHSANGLHRWSEILCTDPPPSEHIEIAFAPTANIEKIEHSILEKLLARATGHATVAAPVFELINREFRAGRLSVHPAQDRVGSLSTLLGNLVGQLAKIEEGNLPSNSTANSIAKTVNESVDLIIALIDTLALNNAVESTGKLNQAMGLKHRRIRVEAAAALARLKDESGIDSLIAMADHAVVRPRVIAYAKELGLENKISLEFRGPIAEAESNLALWLSSPDQMGIAPTEIELKDQRKLYWPSYETPVDCFLFEFNYGAADSVYKNIGISGPLTHAFTADLTQLSVADQYSAFAGWQTISDEIFTVPIERATQLLAGDFDRLVRKMAAVDSINGAQPVLFASFFGEYVLVCHATADDQPGTLIVDDASESWISAGNPEAPIPHELAFDIWKGRKLLENFNPSLG